MAVSQTVMVGCFWLLAGCSQSNATSERATPTDKPLHVRILETFQLSDADAWIFRTPELWTVADEQGRRYLQMHEPPARPMLPGIRRPQEYAIYAPYEFRSFSLSCFVRVDRDPATKARDAVIIFGRQDDTHLYYVHLSGLSDGVHNTIIRVDGQTRQRILPDNFHPAPVMTDREWHKVDVLRNADTGLIQVYVDAYDEATARPYFEVTDRTYEWGHLALGSFDDFASFAQIRIEGEARKPATPPTADRAAPASQPESATAAPKRIQ
ncbi:MAG TPA: hypothetical protein PLS23_17605 [Phycisphaerae bacterium]|nr:hypothetical protein [Phycisphaerae bacterium]